MRGAWFVIAFSFFASSGAAQARPTASVVAVALADVIPALRKDGDGRIDGAVAFDPRIVRAPRGRAPATWPGSAMPVWTGNVRDSTWAAEVIGTVLRDVNTRSDVAWVTCGPAPAVRACNTTEFPLVAAASEPWIAGDHAQFLMFVRYRSSIEAHPHAWFVNTVWLKRVGSSWAVERIYNHGGT